MYNSQYYTCEQIDERLLQGYLDDYNTQTGQSLTKAQFLTKLGSIFSKEGVIDNTATQIGYYECDTAAGTAAKAITVANYALFAGGSMKVKFANKNTANNATLNINSQGAKALYYQGERASATNSWDAEEVVEIYYDGTSYYANNVKGGSGSGVYDVSKEHPTSGPNSDGKFTLEYILNSSNVNELIPVNKRYPGMTIQFVSTSDNKYVQARCMAQSFTTDVTQWQGVDDEPTVGSANLVKSGALFDAIKRFPSEEIELTFEGQFYNYWGNVDGDVNLFHRAEYAITKEGLYSFITNLKGYNAYCLLVDDSNNIIRRWSKDDFATNSYGSFSFYAKNGYTIKLSSYKGVYIKLFQLSVDDDVIALINTVKGSLNITATTDNDTKEVSLNKGGSDLVNIPAVVTEKQVITEEKKKQSRTNIGVENVFDGTYSSGTQNIDYNFAQGHKYLFENKGSGQIQVKYVGTDVITVGTALKGARIIFTCSQNANTLRLWGSVANQSFSISDITYIDAKVKEVENILDYNKVYYPLKVIASSADSLNWSVGFVGNNGNISTSQTAYRYNATPISVLPNRKYAVSGLEFSIYMGVRILDTDNNLISVVTTDTNTGWLEFITPNNAASIQFCFLYQGSDITYDSYYRMLYYIDDFTTLDIENLKNRPTEIADIFEPWLIYGRTIPTSGNTIRFNNSVFPEGFVKNDGDRFTINGGKEVLPNEMGKNGTFTEVIRLQDENGLYKNVTLNRKNINPSSITAGTKALVLCIGESTTANQIKNPITQISMGRDDGYNWPSMIMGMSMKDQIDNIGADIITLGTCGPDWKATFEYKEQTRDIYAGYVSHGGWSSYTYLNWPCSCKMINSLSGFFGIEAMYYALGLATKTPYNQETYNVERTEYTGSDAQLEEIISTPFGKYKMDGSSVLWKLLKTLSGTRDPAAGYGNNVYYPVFSGTGDYTGTTEQISLMEAWAEELRDNPTNEFYDKTVGRGGNNFAFSLSKFIERFRTMDNSGNRLVSASTNPAGETVVGADGNTYTIGTKITSQSILKYVNVCQPTHVILNLGINDADGRNTIESSLLIYKRLFNCFGNLPTAHFVFRYPGVCNKGLWMDSVVPLQYKIREVSAKIMTLLSLLNPWIENDTQGDKYSLDVWHVQYPASSYYEKREDSGNYSQLRVDCSYDNVHVGYFAHKSAAWQCLCWLYNKLV